MMTPGHSSEPREAITQRAAVFFERHRFGKWNDADQAELDAWFAESILHEVAYLRLEGAVAHTEELVTFLPFDAELAKAEPRPVRAAPDARRKRMLRRLAFPLLAAASIALVAALGIPLATSVMRPSDRVYSTEVGGRTLLSFADHTQIELNTDTVARFRMTTHERTVWLDKGEAWFHVAHDAAHPFTVIVGKHRVTDLGTEFLIRSGSDGTAVTLFNGRAALSTEGEPTAALKPGDEAVATPVSMVVVHRTPQELANELAWRRGLLAFRNAKLSDVVREFNRYNTTKLVITDPSVADKKLSADLRTDDYEGFLQLVQTGLNLRADREGDVILISRASREDAKKAAHLKRSL